MNRRSFFGSLCGAALLALASGTRLAETALCVSKGGRSPTILVFDPEWRCLTRRWCTWNEHGHPTWHRVPVGEPGVDSPYLDDWL